MLGEGVRKLLNKPYPASSINEITYHGRNIAFKTDKEGRPVLLFIGKKIAPGKIRGEHYMRSIITTSEGKPKDHWEKKGRFTS